MKENRDVWIVVLGDIGRSPRMQFHAMSLVQSSARTIRFFGFVESVDGIRPELLDAQTSGRLQFVPVYNMYAPSVAHTIAADNLVLTYAC
jgi:hypothetical protein